MASVFGSCGDKFVTWETGLFDELGRDIIRFTSADGEETLDLCLDPAKGAMIGEEVLPVIDGMIQLPSDMFGSGELSEDGGIYTITFPGQEPQDLCVNPVKTVNGVAPDEAGDVVTSDEKGVETINGVAPDEEGNIDLPSSTTEFESENNVHRIVTDDGNDTIVCRRQYKGLRYNEDGTFTEIFITQSGEEREQETFGSTTVPSDDGQFHSITTIDGVPTNVCANQYKGLRFDEATGEYTEVFVNQAGDEVLGAVIAEPTQTGEAQLSTVDADGNTTYVDSDGATQTTPATDVNGDPVDPSQPVWNFVDGQGNYLGSKPCKDETVLVQDSEGAVLAFDPDTNNQVLPPITAPPVTDVVDAEGNTQIVDGIVTLPAPVELLDCAGEVLADPISPLTKEQGHAPLLVSEATGLEVDASCKPEIPDCPIDGMRKITQNDYGTVDWEIQGGDWVAVMASPKNFVLRDNAPTQDLTPDVLSGANSTGDVPDDGVSSGNFDITLGNSWQTLARRCIEIVNDDCVAWTLRFNYRWAHAGGLQGGNFSQAQIVGAGDIASGHFNGTSITRADHRCDSEDCARLFSDVLTAETSREYILPPGETFNGCVELAYRVNELSTVSDNNEVGGQILGLQAEIHRTCG